MDLIQVDFNMPDVVDTPVEEFNWDTFFVTIPEADIVPADQPVNDSNFESFMSPDMLVDNVDMTPDIIGLITNQDWIPI